MLIQAARELFATQGYNGATTRDIASRAGVSDVLIYRHFGSKAGLFAKAVLEPIEEFFSAYAKTWAAQEVGAEPVDLLSRRYVDGVHTLAAEHRGQLLALLAAGEFEDVSGTRTDGTLSPLLDQISEVVRALKDHYGWADVDTLATVRVTFAMVLGEVMLEHWIFPTGRRRPSREAIRREMALFIHHRVMYGVHADPARQAEIR